MPAISQQCQTCNRIPVILNIRIHDSRHDVIFEYNQNLFVVELNIETTFKILKTGFRFYFFKIIFLIENCIMLKKIRVKLNSCMVISQEMIAGMSGLCAVSLLQQG